MKLIRYQKNNEELFGIYENNKIVESIKEAEKDVISGTTTFDMQATIAEKKRLALTGSQPTDDDHFKGAEEGLKAEELRQFTETVKTGVAKEEQRVLHEKAGKQWRDEEGGVVEEKNTKTNLQEVLSSNETNKFDHYRNEEGDVLDSTRRKGGSARKGRSRYGFDRNSLVSTDPYAFSTHAYPSDVVEDFTNGHYMLFYVNVQDKTKYLFNGYDDKGNEVTVGDMVETHNVGSLSAGGNPCVGGDEQGAFQLGLLPPPLQSLRLRKAGSLRCVRYRIFPPDRVSCRTILRGP